MYFYFAPINYNTGKQTDFDDKNFMDALPSDGYVKGALKALQETSTIGTGTVEGRTAAVKSAANVKAAVTQDLTPQGIVLSQRAQTAAARMAGNLGPVKREQELNRIMARLTEIAAAQITDQQKEIMAAKVLNIKMAGGRGGENTTIFTNRRIGGLDPVVDMYGR